MCVCVCVCNVFVEFPVGNWYALVKSMVSWWTMGVVQAARPGIVEEEGFCLSGGERETHTQERGGVFSFRSFGLTWTF